jgi:hypothetical protein
MAMIIAGCFVTGCSQDEDTTGLNEVDVITQSKEYEDYLIAYYTFINGCGTIQDSPQSIGQINGKNVWRKTVNKFDHKLLYNAVDSYTVLINKFPEYLQINDTKKYELLNKVSIKSEKITRLIPIDKLSPTIRLKQDYEFPSIPNFFYTWFESIVDAFQACMTYSQTNNVESGGYIFPDGRALLIIDSLATDTSMNIPVWRNGASAQFHYHPDSTTNMSFQDSIASQIFLQYGIDSMIIISHDTISGYGF